MKKKLDRTCWAGFLGILSLFFSCSNFDRLEYALDFAGTNRIELEKVLQHYTDSGLKYKAACFLIENMPHYYFYEGKELDTLRLLQASIYKKRHLEHEVRDKWQKFSYRSLKKVYDAQVITADYLISNIDLAFAAWNKRPWSKHYSFEEFCEWILPYRIGDEPLENWRPVYYKKYSHLLDSLYQGTDVVAAADSVIKRATRRKNVFSADLTLPHLGAMFLMEQCVGYCRETSDFCSYVLRSAGIPAAIDFYRYSPEMQGGHSWSVIKDTTGNIVTFWFEPPVRGKRDKRKRGKVYRTCFGWQKEEIKGIRQSKSIPDVLKDAYSTDVTAEYFGKNRIEVEIDVPKKNEGDKYACLAVFSSLGWKPVDIVYLKDRKAVVEDIEPEIIYIILSRVGSSWRPVSYPFRWIEEKVCYFEPDEKQLERVNLLRKYPLRGWTKFHIAGVVGSRLEASNSLDFKQKELIYHIVDTPRINYNEILCSPRQKYRYVRYTGPDGGQAKIAELMFYNSKDSSIPLPVKAVEGSQPAKDNKEEAKDKVCDGDYLTYFMSKQKRGYVTLDLSEPQFIKKIVYIPRNDENFVRIGDEYELFYQKGRKGWVSLGRKRADEPRLVYNKVPKNALLWLRNLSRGKEEEIFFMKEGEQKFLCEEPIFAPGSSY